jgi:carbon storage regulator
MLVIRRRAGQAVRIGEQIEITVIETSGGTVKLGITAPRQIPVLRKEIAVALEENRRAALALPPERLGELLGRLRRTAP